MNIMNNIKIDKCQNRCPKKSVIKNQGMSKKTWVSSSEQWQPNTAIKKTIGNGLYLL